MNRQQKDWRSDFMDLLSTSNIYDHTNAKQRKFLIDFIRQNRQQAVAEENKAWFLGKRCTACGGEKKENENWSTCDECD
jgi:hypothetical protein